MDYKEDFQQIANRIGGTYVERGTFAMPKSRNVNANFKNWKILITAWADTIQTRGSTVMYLR